MIETIKLTDEQVQAMRSQDSDLLMTQEHLDLIRRSGPGSGHHAMFIDNQLVRMPSAEFNEMLKTAFRAGWISAMRELGISDENLIEKFDLAEPRYGDSFFAVTLTLHDGRAATGLGELVVPTMTTH
jgi:hypothetical protein